MGSLSHPSIKDHVNTSGMTELGRTGPLPKAAWDRDWGTSGWPSTERLSCGFEKKSMATSPHVYLNPILEGAASQSQT